MADIWRAFASDNYAGVHPEVLEAIARVNAGHQPAYGDDAVTSRLTDVVREHFGPRAEAFPVLNGTGANVVALQSLTRRWEAVVCAQTAHVNSDEGGAPEHVGGLKLHAVPTPDGKLTPELLETQAWGFGDVHRAQPAAVTISESTELGTVYTAAQIGALADAAHTHGLGLHLDGARVANAAVSLGVELSGITTDVGVDVLSFGGTKNGILLGEAVIVLDPERAQGVDYLRKTSMQLASKMRFISAQLLALLDGDLWRRNAEHANSMAALLAERVGDVVSMTQPREANAVFAVLPHDAAERLRERFRFYTWDHTRGEVRWMCSWDTTVEDVESFARAVRQECA